MGVVPAEAKLAAKPEAIQDWDALGADEKRLFTRQAEVFAGFAEHTDHEIGRLVQAIEDLGDDRQGDGRGAIGAPADGTAPPESIRWMLLPALLTLLTAAAASAAGGGQCSDPCVAAARLARQQCVSSAAGAFQDDLLGCLEREPGCLGACRTELQDCRDGLGLREDLASCRAEFLASSARCRIDHPPGSIRQARCIERARVQELRCERRARRAARTGLRGCRADFTGCARGCAPGAPPGGIGACRDEARMAFSAARRECKAVFRTTTRGCLDREIDCVQTCADDAAACKATAQSILDMANASCAAQREAAVAECGAAHPGGGAALHECIRDALSAAFACRAAAAESTAPAFASCAASYVECVRGCPSLP